MNITYMSNQPTDNTTGVNKGKTFFNSLNFVILLLHKIPPVFLFFLTKAYVAPPASTVPASKKQIKEEKHVKQAQIVSQPVSL